tara:strand:- start:2588 stop:3187 length:600 start_codon:yes stop_codon:yes gene_type:complete
MDKCLDTPIIFKEIFRSAGDSKKLIHDLLGYEYMGNFDASFWNIFCDAAEGNNYKNIVSKIFYYHNPSDRELWNAFDKDHQIIHLIRANIFDFFVSLKIAQETGKWKNKNENENNSLKSSVMITINRQEALDFIKLRTDQTLALREEKKHLDNYFELFYEDIGEPIEACIQKVASIYELDCNYNIEIGNKKQKTKKILK